MSLLVYCYISCWGRTVREGGTVKKMEKAANNMVRRPVIIHTMSSCPDHFHLNREQFIVTQSLFYFQILINFKFFLLRTQHYFRILPAMILIYKTSNPIPIISNEMFRIKLLLQEKKTGKYKQAYIVVPLHGNKYDICINIYR